MFDGDGMTTVSELAIRRWRRCAPRSCLTLPDARIEEDFAELHRASRSCSRPSACAAWPRSTGGGSTPVTATCRWRRGWLGVHRVAWGVAREQVRLARGLEADAGDPPGRWRPASSRCRRARSLVAAREADPDAFERCRARPGRGRPGAHGRPSSSGSSPSGGQRVERDRASRGAGRLARTPGACTPRSRSAGWCGWTGTWIPRPGSSLLTALRAVLDAEAVATVRSRHGRSADRTPAQRRADALGEICRQWLDGRRAPGRSRGERPAPDASRWASRRAPGVGTASRPSSTTPVRCNPSRPAAWRATPRCCGW